MGFRLLPAGKSPPGYFRVTEGKFSFPHPPSNYNDHNGIAQLFFVRPNLLLQCHGGSDCAQPRMIPRHVVVLATFSLFWLHSFYTVILHVKSNRNTNKWGLHSMTQWAPEEGQISIQIIHIRGIFQPVTVMCQNVPLKHLTYHFSMWEDSTAAEYCAVSLGVLHKRGAEVGKRNPTFVGLVASIRSHFPFPGSVVDSCHGCGQTAA